MNSELLAIGVVVVVFATLVITRFFGHHESRLLGHYIKHFFSSLVPAIPTRDANARKLQTRLEGDAQWEELWETLTGFAERFDLDSVQLNIHLPAHGEEFHASWQRKISREEKELWHSDIPLFVADVSIGRVKITGACTHNSVFTWMSDLIAGMQPFETQLVDLVGDCVAPFKNESSRDKRLQVIRIASKRNPNDVVELNATLDHVTSHD